jgi:phosphopantothenoylcysteine decarboxylase/phosphopantothenate--cysteine ligase
MNTAMWEHPATCANLEILRKRGVSIIEPGEGWLACGTAGAGRLPDPAQIADEIEAFAPSRRDLEGESILITAGPTQEPIDPVRYISNRSSGKMGYALASEAARRGAKVTLISGPVDLPAPRGVDVVRVVTAKEMFDTVMAHLADATIIIKNAAVADYYIADVPKQKIKKTATRLSLDLEPTPDILAAVGERKGDRLLIGFAAETQNLLEEARRKMISKKCDMVVGNLVNKDGLGFESDRNEVEILTRAGQIAHAGPADKKEIAARILDQVSMLRLALHAIDA